MRIIKLDATDSTNAYLKNAMLSEVLDDFTIVIAGEQLKGRGQMGATWQSEAGKNLTFSVLKNFDGLLAKDQFILNIAVSMAIYNTLKKLQLPGLSIKWPNDILSGNSKICGILIENLLNEQNIQSAVIGIGLNVNQQSFPGLGNVTSIKLLTGTTMALDEVLQLLLGHLQQIFIRLKGKTVGDVKKEYEQLLFRRGKPSTFKDAQGELFMGFIRGISDSGKLCIALEDDIVRECSFKEVELLY